MQAEVFHYELVDEHGVPIGALAHESDDLNTGDIVACDGHMFEIRTVDETTLQVRRVI
ncbi:MAG: hypothetical protein ACYDA3_00290 [Gaiellaceae bacterium]